MKRISPARWRELLDGVDLALARAAADLYNGSRALRNTGNPYLARLAADIFHLRLETRRLQKRVVELRNL